MQLAGIKPGTEYRDGQDQYTSHNEVAFVDTGNDQRVEGFTVRFQHISLFWRFYIHSFYNPLSNKKQTTQWLLRKKR